MIRSYTFDELRGTTLSPCCLGCTAMCFEASVVTDSRISLIILSGKIYKCFVFWEKNVLEKEW